MKHRYTLEQIELQKAKAIAATPSAEMKASMQTYIGCDADGYYWIGGGICPVDISGIFTPNEFIDVYYDAVKRVVRDGTGTRTLLWEHYDGRNWNTGGGPLPLFNSTFYRWYSKPKEVIQVTSKAVVFPIPAPLRSPPPEGTPVWILFVADECSRHWKNGKSWTYECFEEGRVYLSKEDRDSAEKLITQILKSPAIETS
jgi:hypothetical protein